MIEFKIDEKWSIIDIEGIPRRITRYGETKPSYECDNVHIALMYKAKELETDNERLQGELNNCREAHARHLTEIKKSKQDKP